MKKVFCFHFFKNLLLSVFFLVVVLSCNEKIGLDESQDSIVVNKAESYVDPYFFDWEDPSLDYFPYPQDQQRIAPPWIGGGGLSSIVSPDVLDDRRAADGWEMIYSTFHPTIWNPNPYFMLYNKYRGLLRIYFYLNTVNNIVESSYLQGGLTTNEQTSLLNFCDKEIVDVDESFFRVDRVEPMTYSGTSTSNNRWYFFQYEMAYDPNLNVAPPLSSTAPKLSFYLNTINVSQISLGGTLQASVDGSIGASQASSHQNIWNSANGVLQNMGKGAVSAVGKSFIDNKTLDSNGNNKYGIRKNTWKTIKAGVDAAMQMNVTQIPGAVYNVLSAIFKGSTSNSGQTVSLTVDGSIELNGTLTGRGAFPSTPVDFYIPGTLTPPFGVQYYVPLYNKKLGVFNLANKPTVKVKTERSGYNPNDGTYLYQTYYSLKNGTLNFIWNQDFLDVADVGTPQYEVVAIFQQQHQNYLYYDTGRDEEIHGWDAITGRDFKTVHFAPERPYTYVDVYLRVSFVVSPKNGAPKSVIVKTFKVNKEDSFVML